VAGEVETARIGRDVITVVEIKVEQQLQACGIAAQGGYGKKSDQDSGKHYHLPVRREMSGRAYCNWKVTVTLAETETGPA
jgi:hypothetical protein